MGYLICEKCGGYYKLEKGESPEDFEACNCGGTLSYVEYIQKDRTKPKNAIKCTICGHEQEKGLICSKCGSRIKIKTNYQNKRYHQNRNDYRHVLAESSSINILEKIQWSGVTSGIVFYIVASIIIRIVGGDIFRGKYYCSSKYKHNCNISYCRYFGDVFWINLSPYSGSIWFLGNIKYHNKRLCNWYNNWGYGWSYNRNSFWNTFSDRWVVIFRILWANKYWCWNHIGINGINNRYNIWRRYDSCRWVNSCLC